MAITASMMMPRSLDLRQPRSIYEPEVHGSYRHRSPNPKPPTSRSRLPVRKIDPCSSSSILNSLATFSNMSLTFSPKQLSKTKAFECDILRFEHTSPTLGNLRATFSAIVPVVPNVSPVLYWLSGLTCTDENFIIKAGAAQHAAQNGVIIVCPDTSPRGANAPSENDNWDFGTGAGFYVDATTEDFHTHYRMASYVVDELPSVVAEALSGRVIKDIRSVFGHSMGGMGALSLALRNEGKFVSVSAFAPIANPVKCPWGEKCYAGYLGEDTAEWKKYDPTELMKARVRPLFNSEILIEQGDEDSFLETQLHPSAFVEACKSVGQQVALNMDEGYDHSYFFIQTFVGKHIEFHAWQLKKALEASV